MKLYYETAKRIRDLFGSCTVMYECMTIDNVIEEAKKFDTLEEYFCFELEMQELWCEKQREACNLGGLNVLEEGISDNETWILCIKERLEQEFKVKL